MTFCMSFLSYFIFISKKFSITLPLHSYKFWCYDGGNSWYHIGKQTSSRLTTRSFSLTLEDSSLITLPHFQNECIDTINTSYQKKLFVREYESLRICTYYPFLVTCIPHSKHQFYNSSHTTHSIIPKEMYNRGEYPFSNHIARVMNISSQPLSPIKCALSSFKPTILYFQEQYQQSKRYKTKPYQKFTNDIFQRD